MRGSRKEAVSERRFVLRGECRRRTSKKGDLLSWRVLQRRIWRPTDVASLHVLVRRTRYLTAPKPTALSPVVAEKVACGQPVRFREAPLWPDRP